MNKLEEKHLEAIIKCKTHISMWDVRPITKACAGITEEEIMLFDQWKYANGWSYDSPGFYNKESVISGRIEYIKKSGKKLFSLYLKELETKK